ncbi:MAG: mannose-1-phosphate guanylyltransferase [Candidatus Korobacteraceae bacterium]
MGESASSNFYPVILAGGRGTRFWPLSRKRRAKQLLPLNSAKSMIQETVERLLPLAPARNFWLVTNEDLRKPILQQLPELAADQVLAEPVGRNTAPAIGLAAFMLERIDPSAIIGMFPSDHVIFEEQRFDENVRRAAEIAAAGPNIVVMGITPSRPETGYGYIEAGHPAEDGALQVVRFTEKPDLGLAEQFVAAGTFYWNSGMFVWSARTLADALREHLPNTAPILEQIAASYGTTGFEAKFAELYPKCENISIDYAVLEPRSKKGEGKSRIFCIPADFGWNDLGSWTALYEHRAAADPTLKNIISSQQSFTLRASGNFVHSEKFVAMVGVNDLVVVETDDALLITTREQAQDVGKVVAYLDQQKLTKLV